MCLGEHNFEITLEFVEELRGSRNLLAFSGGVDSSALYFLLKSYQIPFDVAIMNYGMRKQAALEVSYAQNLCLMDNKRCFVEYAPKIHNNFESNARKLRYDFFENLIMHFGYSHLILAHQLDDMLEWFLMQFCKGTNLQKMQMSPKYKRICIREIQQEKISYWIVRPLWQVSHTEILKYLQKNHFFYFEDFSNLNPRYQRNYFRINFTKRLLSEFESGIAFSLKELCKGFQQESVAPTNQVFEIPTLGKFCVLGLESLNNALESVDLVCKICGVLLSRVQKLELKRLLEEKSFSQVFRHKIAIEKIKGKIFLSTYTYSLVIIPKKLREKYRCLGIPKKFRIFLFQARNLGFEQRVLDKIIES